jgi:hypothetical protein
LEIEKAKAESLQNQASEKSEKEKKMIKKVKGRVKKNGQVQASSSEK